MSQPSYSNGPSDGGKYIDSLDPDDPEYQRQLIRPIEVKEDVRRMEERKRVNLVLHSRAFRDELEELVIEQLNPLSGPAQQTVGSSMSAQQLSELIQPLARTAHAKRGVGPCIPVADVRELEVMDYDKGERQFRCKLASLYRLIDLFGWSHGIQNYVTGRINQDFEHFLIAPYGLMHHEVTATSLVKVDMRGDVLDAGSTVLGVNKTGFSLHSAIYASRPDIKCVVHIRCTPAVSVSALNLGLMPLCPETMAVGEISYFDYTGGYVDMEQRDKLRRSIGPINKVFVLRNFGIIVGGETIEEAFYLVRNVMTGVDTQLRLIAQDFSKIVLPSDEEKRRAFEAANAATDSGNDERKWRRGEQEFETLMKHLDNYGYRTGYLYRDRVERKLEKTGRSTSEVMVPPTSTSYIYTYEDEHTRAKSPVKGKTGGSLVKGSKKEHKSSDWKSFPEKERLDETNALDVTKASKWAPEDTSTPIKPEQTGSRKEHKPAKESQFEMTIAETSVSGEPLATQMKASPVNAAPLRVESSSGSVKQPVSPQKSISSTEDILHDRETSPEKQSGRETPGSTKEKKKKKWPFGGSSKKKEKQ